MNQCLGSDSIVSYLDPALSFKPVSASGPAFLSYSPVTCASWLSFISESSPSSHQGLKGLVGSDLGFTPSLETPATLAHTVPSDLLANSYPLPRSGLTVTSF